MAKKKVVKWVGFPGLRKIKCRSPGSSFVRHSSIKSINVKNRQGRINSVKH